MFDTVIFSPPGPEAAARTLATLVEGVVEGMLGRATVICMTESPEMDKLGHASGCNVLATSDRAILRSALPEAMTTPHVLAFQAGALLPPGWPQMLKAEINQRGMPGTAVAALFEPETTKERVKLFLKQSIRGRFPLDHGAIVPRQVFFDGFYNGRTVKVMGPVHMSRLRVGRISA